MAEDEPTASRGRGKDTQPRKTYVKLPAWISDPVPGETKAEHLRRYSRQRYQYLKEHDPEFSRRNVQSVARGRKLHPERSKEKRKAEYQKAQDVIKLRVAKWFKANRAKALEYRREYYQANKDRIQEDQKRWKTANRDRLYSIQHNQRVKGRAAAGRFTAADINEILAAQKGRCALCRVKLGKTKHLDHIVPISKGGTNHRSNIQWTCALCNQRKASKDQMDFARELGLLL